MEPDEGFIPLGANASGLEVACEMCEREGAHFTITRKGRPCAVLVPYDIWTLMVEKIDRLSGRESPDA